MKAKIGFVRLIRSHLWCSRCIFVVVDVYWNIVIPATNWHFLRPDERSLLYIRVDSWSHRMRAPKSCNQLFFEKTISRCFTFIFVHGKSDFSLSTWLQNSFHTKREWDKYFHFSNSSLNFCFFSLGFCNFLWEESLIFLHFGILLHEICPSIKKYWFNSSRH